MGTLSELPRRERQLSFFRLFRILSEPFWNRNVFRGCALQFHSLSVLMPTCITPYYPRVIRGAKLKLAFRRNARSFLLPISIRNLSPPRTTAQQAKEGGSSQADSVALKSSTIIRLFEGRYQRRIPLVAGGSMRTRGLRANWWIFAGTQPWTVARPFVAEEGTQGLYCASFVTEILAAIVRGTSATARGLKNGIARIPRVSRDAPFFPGRLITS